MMVDYPCDQAKNKHFSFILKRNKVISIGWNKSFQTHPKCQKIGYRYSCIHSEFDAILKAIKKGMDISRCYIVNTRINRFLEMDKMCKPCRLCMGFIKENGIRDVYYTDFDGKFQHIDTRMFT